MSNQIQPYNGPRDPAPERGAGRRRGSPVFGGLPGEMGSEMMLPAPGNANFAVGNSIQPRDKMAQYRDAALVRRSLAPALRPTRYARRGLLTAWLCRTLAQDFYNNGQVQPAPGDIPLAGVLGMDRPLDQTQGSLADMLANVSLAPAPRARSPPSRAIARARAPTPPLSPRS
jgi:hypothetical protein